MDLIDLVQDFHRYWVLTEAFCCIGTFFPLKPEVTVILEPLHPHELLSWMRIPSYPGVYVLGSFAHHVTIYSQQIRAFNLIDALCKTGLLRPGVSVAVVGGGIAGLTAATAATVRGADVSIIESDKGFFPIQRQAGARYLHPHIYDWPLSELESGEESKARFPFLDWEAGEADVVCRHLKEDWDQLFKTGPNKLQKPKELMGTRLTGLVPKPEHGGSQLTVETDSADSKTPKSKILEAEIVILALGFGREFGRADLQRYWEQAPFDAVPPKPLRWLVSGFGDGGLTDLMRLCIDGFRHDEFVKKHEGDSRLASKLKELLADNRKQSIKSAFEELYQQLDDKSLIAKHQLRTNTEVTFNAPTNYLESEGSSILNRFFVFQLEKLGKFKLQPGRLKSIPELKLTDPPYTVEFTDKDGSHEDRKVIATADFDRLIIRHGPERPISEASFPEIWQATKCLREKWAAQSQSNDRTRVRIWDPADYDPKNAPNPIMLEEKWNEGVDLRCVVVESTVLRAEVSLSNLVRTALNSNKKAMGLAMKPPRDEGKINAGFKTIRINDALGSQKEYNRAIGLLCEADIAVIDVTKYEPGIMLFLGIRSAVQRGVTIVTTNLELDAAAWSSLPFNLKELYPLSLTPRTQDINSSEHPNQIMGRTIARALGHFHSLPFYQDVPAYEALRRFDPAPKEEAQSILWLCSFHKNYKPLAGYIQNGFSEEYGNDLSERNERKYLLQRIIEIVSPQLVTQRLYSAIRSTVLCLVDWSFWSPNVFFEFGVRLATSNFGPVCLLAKNVPDLLREKEPDPADAVNDNTDALLQQRERLKKLFSPLEYDLEGDWREVFQEVRARHTAMLEYEIPDRRSNIPPTFGAFSSAHTYKFVGMRLRLKNEPGAAGADIFLTSSADSLIGVSSTTEPSLPVLYANVNQELDKQARNAAKEMLIAAWYYLGNRYHDELQEPGDLLKSYEDLSIRLANLLEQSDDPKDQALYRSVRQTLKTVKKIIKGVHQ